MTSNPSNPGVAIPRPMEVAGIVVVLALAAYAASLVLRTPCLGVADNQDYWRVMRPAGILHVQPEDPPGQFVACRYVLSEPQLGSLFSTPALLARAARWLNWSAHDVGAHGLDLRQMGLSYLVLFGAALALGLRWRVSPWLLAGLVWVMVDPGYVLFFNSFYADPAMFVALIGVVAWFVAQDALGRPSSRLESALQVTTLLALAALGGVSKMQFILFPAVVLSGVLALAVLRSGAADARRERTSLRPVSMGSLLAGLAVLAVVAPWWFYQGPAPRFLEVNNYHAVFAGLLEATENPARALEALRVDAQHEGLPRADVWSGKVPLDHPVFDELRGLSRWQLARLYLSEPAALRSAAVRIERVFAWDRTHLRGNFSRSTGRARPNAQYSSGWAFSRVRGWVFGRFPWMLWVILGATTVWLVAGILTGAWSATRSAGLVLLLFALSQFAVAVVGDGFVSLEQHLIAARLSVDLLIVLGVGAALRYSTPSALTRNA